MTLIEKLCYILSSLFMNLIDNWIAIRRNFDFILHSLKRQIKSSYFFFKFKNAIIYYEV